MIKAFLHLLVRLLWRFRGYNLDPLKTPGPVLLLPNHVSWFDWIFVGVFLDNDWRFVTSSATAQISWVHRLIMDNHRTFPVDMNSPYAVKHIAEFLQSGGRLVLFPEGRISQTGSLMKLYDGTGFLVSKVRPKVITAYIRGADRLPFSRNPNRKRLFPRVTVHFSDVLSPPDVTHLSVSLARAKITNWVRSTLVRQHFDVEMEFGPATVPEAIVAAANQFPGRTILQDATLTELTYRRVMAGSSLLKSQWENRLQPDAPRVGVLLPNVNATPVVLLSLWGAGKVPAVLNYTSGPATLLACSRVAGLKQIITSRVFLTRSRLDVKPLEKAGIELVMLEDVRGAIGSGRKLMEMLRQIVRPGLPVESAATDGPAIILFTSGSEGDPKAVELSHRNLLANVQQMISVIDLMDQDRFFNALPLFHSFGLTVGLFLPLIQGVFVFLYLSPLHYRVVPAAFYNLNCTVFFATNTFLMGYARKAHPFDFRSVRYLFAGAEKIQEVTSTMWMRKFGVRILEGYGATECSPCISVNLPMNPRHGSAGTFLPAIDYKLEPVEGISESEEASGNGKGTHSRSGRLFIRGPNVMRGYLNPEPNGAFQALGGWYDTGDIARVDEDGFVHILGRLKRFAKISGEMVSLTAVEEALSQAFPQYGPKFAVAVVAQRDESKGEKLVAVTNDSRLTIEQVREVTRGKGLGNLAAPRELKLVHDLPRLGSGKIDHRRLQQDLAAATTS